MPVGGALEGEWGQRGAGLQVEGIWACSGTALAQADWRVADGDRLGQAAGFRVTSVRKDVALEGSLWLEAGSEAILVAQVSTVMVA